jgi:hypothetical protein
MEHHKTNGDYRAVDLAIFTYFTMMAIFITSASVLYSASAGVTEKNGVRMDYFYVIIKLLLHSKFKPQYPTSEMFSCIDTDSSRSTVLHLSSRDCQQYSCGHLVSLGRVLVCSREF